MFANSAIVVHVFGTLLVKESRIQSEILDMGTREIILSGHPKNLPSADQLRQISNMVCAFFVLICNRRVFSY